MASKAELQAELEALDAQLAKVQAELDTALHPPVQSLVITALAGVFADDAGISVGDTAHVVVVRGRVGQMNGNGIWNDIDPNTIVEYWVTHAGVDSNKTVESFYAG